MPKLPSFATYSTLQPQPEAVLDSRITQKGRYSSKEEILVKWISAPAENVKMGKQVEIPLSISQFFSLRTRTESEGWIDANVMVTSHAKHARGTQVLSFFSSLFCSVE